MSFHSVRIVKSFPKNNTNKIIFKKKSKKLASKKSISIQITKKLVNNLEKNIEIKKLVENPKKITDNKPREKKLKSNKEREIYNYKDFVTFNVLAQESDTLHYIGLIIVNSNSVNTLHNLSYSNIDSIYLNVTRFLVYQHDKFPIIEIPNNDYQPGFKFKKFIKKHLTIEWKMNKKFIQAIKLLGNYGNLHLYTIVTNDPLFVKSKKFLKGEGIKYSWRNILDQYTIDKDDLNTKIIDQHNIYKKILSNRNSSLVKYTFNLKPETYNDTFKEYLLNYEYILHQLSSYH